MSYPLCRDFGIDESGIARRLEMLAFTPRDDERLETLRGIIANNVKLLVDAFYKHVVRFPELSRFIANEQRLERLREVLISHLTSLGQDVRTLRYFESRLRVGVVHEKMGILHKWYIAAHSQIRTIITDLVLTQSEGRDARELLASLHKVLSLDLALAMETYHRSAVTRIEMLMHQLEVGQEEIRKLAQTDPLTGLFNRRQFFDRLESELHRGQRYGRPFCLLLLDLDDFKAVNDRFRHQMGDQVLKAIGCLLPTQIRHADFCGRLGGDELAVVLTEMSLPTAELIAERIRLSIMQKEFESGDARFSVGVSIGIAEWTPEIPDTGSLLRLADESLYNVKSSGRNGRRAGEALLPS